MGNDANARFEELHARHATALMRFLTTLNRGRHQHAEDLLQETMLRAWQHVGRLPDTEEGERRWLFTVARRLAIDAARAGRRRPAEVSVLDLEALAVTTVTPDEALAVHSIEQAFGRLSRDHREVLADLHLRGMPVAAIAARHRLPVGTVKSRAHYAMRALRDGLQVYAS